MSVLNSRNKRKFAIENSQLFQAFLTSEEKILTEFKKVYQQLIETLPNSVDEEVKLFNIRYQIYQVATNIWINKAHIEVADMKDAIATLETNRLDLAAELNDQELSLQNVSEQLTNSMQALILHNAP